MHDVAKKKKASSHTHTHTHTNIHIHRVSEVVPVVKNLPASAGDTRNAG